jgi:hypothetical protein
MDPGERAMLEEDHSRETVHEGKFKRETQTDPRKDGKSRTHDKDECECE